MAKYIFSLTTIPSRINNLNTTINSLLKQTIKADKIILNIPKSYNLRFVNSSIDIESIKYDNVIVNSIETDYGPGTKLLGLFENNLLNSLCDNNTFIVLVDDDLIYQNYMLEYFDNYNRKYYNNRLQVASYYCHVFDKIKIAQGADGFFIKSNILNKFYNYFNIIKDYDYVKYHDDLFISYYMKLSNINIEYIIPPYNKLIYITGENSNKNALNSISGKYNRGNLNYKISFILNSIENKGYFNFIKKSLE